MANKLICRQCGKLATDGLCDSCAEEWSKGRLAGSSITLPEMEKPSPKVPRGTSADRGIFTTVRSEESAAAQGKIAETQDFAAISTTVSDLPHHAVRDGGC